MTPEYAMAARLSNNKRRTPCQQSFRIGNSRFAQDKKANKIGNLAGCTDHSSNPLTTDQRGVARVGVCDIGAYEYNPAFDPLSYLFLPINFR
jgi:hypothetical protein